jgi:hypothetical protein
MNSSYNKSSPATSIDRGVFLSATWGRRQGRSMVMIGNDVEQQGRLAPDWFCSKKEV